MTSTLLAPLNAEQQAAIRRIAAFRQRFGEGHFYLACHAALPLALTPELLYCLWINFQQDSYQEPLNIPWIAVSDLILSNLCDEVGYELYEMDTPIRTELLKQLQNDSRFRLKRIRELADFVMAYVEQQLDSPDLDARDLAKGQKLRALAYKNPVEAAHEIAFTLAKLSFEDKTEWIRMAAMLKTLAEPLFEFQTLLVYGRAMADYARGHLSVATAKLVKVVDTSNAIQVIGIDLLIPEEIENLFPSPQISRFGQNSFPKLKSRLGKTSWWLSFGSTLLLVIAISLISTIHQVDAPIPVRRKVDAPVLTSSDVSNLIKDLKDKDVNVRQRAAESLGSLGSNARDAIPELIQASKDINPNVRNAALLALRNMGSAANASIPSLVNILKNEQVSSSERASAAVALGNMGEAAKPYIPDILNILKDRKVDSYVRASAAVALGNMGEAAKPYIPDLTQLLNSSDSLVRQNAASALSIIQKTTEERSSPTVPLITISDLGVSLDAKSLLVMQVESSSPAALVGLQPGDRLIESDGTQLKSLQELQKFLSSKPSKVVLTVKRNQQVRSVQVNF